jgi:hypothetical protein
VSEDHAEEDEAVLDPLMRPHQAYERAHHHFLTGQVGASK